MNNNTALTQAQMAMRARFTNYMKTETNLSDVKQFTRVGCTLRMLVTRVEVKLYESTASYHSPAADNITSDKLRIHGFVEIPRELDKKWIDKDYAQLCVHPETGARGIKVRCSMTNNSRLYSTQHDEQRRVLRAAALKEGMSPEEVDTKYGEENSLTSKANEKGWRVFYEGQEVSIRGVNSSDVAGANGTKLLQVWDTVVFENLSFDAYVMQPSRVNKEGTNIPRDFTWYTLCSSIVVMRYSSEAKKLMFDQLMGQWPVGMLTPRATKLQQNVMHATWIDDVFALNRRLAAEGSRVSYEPYVFCFTFGGESFSQMCNPTGMTYVFDLFKGDSGKRFVANQQKEPCSRVVALFKMQIWKPDETLCVGDNYDRRNDVYDMAFKTGFMCIVVATMYGEAMDSWCPIRNVAMWEILAPVLLNKTPAVMRCFPEIEKSLGTAVTIKNADHFHSMPVEERMKPDTFCLQLKVSECFVDMVDAVERTCVPVTAGEARALLSRGMKYEQLTRGQKVDEVAQVTDVHPPSKFDINSMSVIALNELNPALVNVETKFFSDAAVQQTFLDSRGVRRRRYAFFATPRENGVTETHEDVFTVLREKYCTDFSDMSVLESMAGGLLDASYSMKNPDATQYRPHKLVTESKLTGVGLSSSRTYVLVIDYLQYDLNTRASVVSDSLLRSMQTEVIEEIVSTNTKILAENVGEKRKAADVEPLAKKAATLVAEDEYDQEEEGFM